MTISYNLGIPATNNSPSIDQPNMKINNDNIPTLISVDHVNFNTAGSGQHLQVTFNSNNVPIPPVTPPILFTNTVAGLPQLFYYSGDAAHSSNQYVNATNGSTYLLGGIILKWGVTGNVASGSTISFASAFPNNCYSVIGVQNSAIGTPTTISISNPTASGFQFFFSGGGNRTIFYTAIGN